MYQPTRDEREQFDALLDDIRNRCTGEDLDVIGNALTALLTDIIGYGAASKAGALTKADETRDVIKKGIEKSWDKFTEIKAKIEASEVPH